MISLETLCFVVVIPYRVIVSPSRKYSSTMPPTFWLCIGGTLGDSGSITATKTTLQMVFQVCLVYERCADSWVRGNSLVVTAVRSTCSGWAAPVHISSFFPVDWLLAIASALFVVGHFLAETIGRGTSRRCVPLAWKLCQTDKQSRRQGSKGAQPSDPRSG